MSQPVANTVTKGVIRADNGEVFPGDVYQKTSRANGTQRWVAENWADGCLPVHSVSGENVKLYTSTRNFCGYQHPNGTGLLEHYSHIQAIRTTSGMILGDSGCYGKGWAHCTYPKDTEHRLQLSTLDARLRKEVETIYEITGVDGDVIEFDTGRKYNFDKDEWVVDTMSGEKTSILEL